MRRAARFEALLRFLQTLSTKAADADELVRSNRSVHDLVGRSRQHQAGRRCQSRRAHRQRFRRRRRPRNAGAGRYRQARRAALRWNSGARLLERRRTYRRQICAHRALGTPVSDWRCRRTIAGRLAALARAPRSPGQSKRSPGRTRRSRGGRSRGARGCRGRRGLDVVVVGCRRRRLERDKRTLRRCERRPSRRRPSYYTPEARLGEARRCGFERFGRRRADTAPRGARRGVRRSIFTRSLRLFCVRPRAPRRRRRLLGRRSRIPRRATNQAGQRRRARVGDLWRHYRPLESRRIGALDRRWRAAVARLRHGAQSCWKRPEPFPVRRRRRLRRRQATILRRAARRLSRRRHPRHLSRHALASARTPVRPSSLS